MSKAERLLNKRNRSNHYGRNRHSGNVLVLFVISLLALLIVASLALDGGHLLLNKGRLQNLVDAAALHGAKEIDQGATQVQASAAVSNLLSLNLAHLDQTELARAIDLAGNDDTSTAVLTIEYSKFADPFVNVSSGEDAPYVKVSLTQLTLDNFLANILSFNKQISATAMAGPSTAIKNCFNNLVPMMVCGSSSTPPYGLAQNSLYVMKIGSKTDSPIGPGNFQLIKLVDNGKDAIRTALAGEENITQTCFNTGDNNASVPTEPGNAVGPVAQGLNTRMGAWNGPVNSIDHPRDINICQGEKININDDGSLVLADLSNAYRAATYVTDNAGSTDKSCSAPLTGNIQYTDALPGRRIMNVVIGKCDGKTNGANNLDFYGVGCFFLTQSVENKGPESYVVGEFLHDCPGGGNASLDAADTPGPYKMVLYHVPGSKDS
jgi:Flp pilus assembly protein TadG